MTDVVVLGTDTDTGKTTLSLLWLAAFSDQWQYWKPVETGDSDTDRIRTLVPNVRIHPPLARFRDPVAPPLAAERENRLIPAPAAILEHYQQLDRSCPLWVETFGSSFSPLTLEELQITFLRSMPCWFILVSSSALGCVGRTLQAVESLAVHGIHPRLIAMIGAKDDFAEAQVRKHSSIPVFSLRPPLEWTVGGIAESARDQRNVLDGIAQLLRVPTTTATSNLVRADRAVVWHPYTSLRTPDDPLAVVGMEGAYLQLADGRKILDAISSWWTIQHGHRHPPLMAALQAALHRYDHVLFAGVTHPPAVELAQQILRSVPWHPGKVFYSDNGSTAVEVALKMAYQFWCRQGEPQRTLLVGFEHGYHGDTFGAMAVSRDPLFFGRFEPLLFKALQIPLSASALDRCLTAHSRTVAAVIIEPLVQGAGGMRMHSPKELRAIAEVTQRHGVLLIVDEVMTGGGRTGTFWAHSAANIVPDLICAGKTLAGGILPLAATLVSPTVSEAFDTDDRTWTFFHGHSFTANPLACAVGVANFHLLATNQWQGEVRRIESHWQKHLYELRDSPAVADVRIRGTIAAIELACDGGYLAEVGNIIRRFSLSRGVMLRPLGNVVYAMPPYCISTAELDQIVEVMKEIPRLVTSEQGC